MRRTMALARNLTHDPLGGGDNDLLLELCSCDHRGNQGMSLTSYQHGVRKGIGAGLLFAIREVLKRKMLSPQKRCCAQARSDVLKLLWSSLNHEYVIKRLPPRRRESND